MTTSGAGFCLSRLCECRGLAGGSQMGGQLACFVTTGTEGTVGVALSGNIILETIVAQGCRPIGK